MDVANPDPVVGRFENRTALVTGSTRGIGRAIAKWLAAEGASVVVTGRSVDAGEATVASIEDEGGEALFVQADLREPDAVAALADDAADAYGGLDVLVNNAGVETYTGAGEATLDDWAFVLETDFRSYWLAAKHAVEHVDSGAIVNVSSNHAVATTPGMFPYNAVKAAVDGMTRAMALDFGPHVRVNAIEPGLVAIERTVGDMDETRRRELASIHPVGRVGRPEDVAATVAFLASDHAANVTGACLPVDGGRSAVLQDDALPDYRARRDEQRGAGE